MNHSFQIKEKIIAVAAGREPADLVLKNAVFVNVFAGKLQEGDVAITQGVIAGMGSFGDPGARNETVRYSGKAEIDMTGKVICPGLIDAHIHLESSLSRPASPQRLWTNGGGHGSTAETSQSITETRECWGCLKENGQQL